MSLNFEERPRSIAAFQRSLGFDDAVLPRPVHLDPVREALVPAAPAAARKNTTRFQAAGIGVAVAAVALAGYFVLGRRPTPPAAVPAITAQKPAEAAATMPAVAPRPARSDSEFTEKLLQAQMQLAQANEALRAKTAADDARQNLRLAPTPQADAQALAQRRVQELEAEVQRLRNSPASATPAPAETAARVPPAAAPVSAAPEPPPAESSVSTAVVNAPTPVLLQSARIEPVLDPKRSRQPEYPQQARDLRQQGTVIVKVYVEASGQVSQTVLDRSCGFPVLDQAALAAIKSGFKFLPGQVDGSPQPIWKTLKYTWKLD